MKMNLHVVCPKRISKTSFTKYYLHFKFLFPRFQGVEAFAKHSKFKIEEAVLSVEGLKFCFKSLLKNKSHIYSIWDACYQANKRS